MRLIHLYLFVYFALIVGAGLSLWQAGVLARLPVAPVMVSAVVVVALGFILAAISRPSPSSAVVPE